MLELYSGIVFLGIIVLALFAMPIMKKQREIIKKTGKYPEGYFLGQGMAMGMVAFGIPMGVALGSMGIGPALGLPIGLAIGQAWEKKYKKEGKIRPLTKEEKEMKKKTIKLLFATLSLGVLAFLAIYVVTK